MKRNKIKLSKREMIIIAAVFVIGLILGAFLFGGSDNSAPTKEEAQGEVHEHNHANETIWTCSMHPQIRRDKPGKCPICGMTLIPLADENSDEKAPENTIAFSESAIKLADIETLKVKLGEPHNLVKLFGKVKPDETRISELTSRYPGRIEKLYVNYTGQSVRKGQKLASVYSPELITAQKELLEAVKLAATNPVILEAAKSKLKLWDLSDAQIEQIITNQKPFLYFDVVSPITGTVTMRHVTVGDYVKEGTKLFQVIDLRKVWVVLDAYESDLPWLKLGDKVQFSVQSLPGKTFKEKIAFIDPFLEAKTRVAGVRIEVNNAKMKLKPEMFVNAWINATISGKKDKILIPRSAVLWTGKRSVVYVKIPNLKRPTFQYREVTLGAQAGDFYIIDKGLSQGEEIAVNGVFKIDAASQLAGLPNMMSPPEKEFQVKPKKLKTSAYFGKQLNNLLSAYIVLKDKFVDSDAKEVAKAAQDLSSELQNFDMKKLKGEEHISLMKNNKTILKSLNIVIKSDNIDEQRKQLKPLSAAVIKFVSPFKLKGQKLFVEFCPMADDTKGAFWISQYKTIKNPYFGEQMISCGDVRDSL